MAIESFSGFANLESGPAPDTFALANGASLDGGIVAHGPGDWIDYSAWTTPVSVDLATGTATSVAFISGIQNVRGGNGRDTLTGDSEGNVLVGGAASDLLQAGTGRSVLIGGAGSDTIRGGPADDVLVGGTTTDGLNLPLSEILAEWQSKDSYATRVFDLLHGGGLNGTYVLVPNTTVNFAEANSVLTGGPGDDFFIVGYKVDSITDLQPGETVN